MNLHRLYGIFFLMLGLGVGLFVLIRSTIFSPDTELEPPTVVVEEQTASNTPGAATTTQPAVAHPVVVAPSEYPARLIIPSAGVNAAVQYVGVKPDGVMANPSNFTDVAWYKNGTVPGTDGSAVIAGHVDNALALSGVFKNLKDMQVGDEVVVRQKNGNELRFRVDRIEYYPYKEAPNREIFLSSDGKAHLNLVTCAGTWIKAEKSYSERLVVYTTLAE